MRARKRFGQNFLVDRNYIHKIINAVAPRETDHIIEIGPGRGALTEALLASACSLKVVEIDRDLAATLKQQFEDLDIIEADILDVDLGSLLWDRTRMVGNLPYNISTPLLFRLFPHADKISDMHFMLQNEVVERMVATPSTRAYGRLSVMTQYYCTPALLFRVPPAAFSPRPAVTSAIVRLEPHTRARASDDRIMESIVAEAFNQRRKTLRNALKKILSEAELLAIGVDPKARAENLDVSDYIACANHVAQRGDN